MYSFSHTTRIQEVENPGKQGERERPVGDGHVPNVQVLDSDGMSDRVLSTSFVANLPDDQRAALLDRVKKLWVEHGEPGVLRYVTDVHWCIKQS